MPRILGSSETNHISVQVDVGDEWAIRVATAQRRGSRIAHAKREADRLGGIYWTPEHTPEREARDASGAPVLDSWDLMKPGPKPSSGKNQAGTNAQTNAAPWYARLWGFLFG